MVPLNDHGCLEAWGLRIPRCETQYFSRLSILNEDQTKQDLAERHIIQYETELPNLSSCNYFILLLGELRRQK